MSKLYTQPWEDYELLDAGSDKKLERWGKTITIRPDRNAYFKPVWDSKKWRELAHFEFKEQTSTKGEWVALKEGVPTDWNITFKGLVFSLKLTSFKHVGVFPEQKINWEFLQSKLNKGDRFLNLFGYTGGASVVAKKAGADVFHCDSVRQINQWAKANMELSNLSDIHWVVEDALKFAQREVKRGHKYKGIIMDPPAFGLGAKKERWKIETLFPKLIEVASQLLEKDGFLIANTYSPRLKLNDIKMVVDNHFSHKKIEINTLCVKTKTGKTIEYGELTRVMNH